MGVSGDTRIQTKTGCHRIADIAGRELVQPWTGKRWGDPVRIKDAPPQKKKMYRVTLSDGSYLDCTGDHWCVGSALKVPRVFTMVGTESASPPQVDRDSQTDVSGNASGVHQRLNQGTSGRRWPV
jgi:hypothetical protein